MTFGKKVTPVTRITEKEYRAIKSALSYSSVKLFDYDRAAFYKEIVLGEVRAEKPTASKTLGSLVHSFLAGETEDTSAFSQKFHILQCAPLSETTHMYTLVENLFERTLKSLNEYGEQQDKFETIFSDAYQRTRYNYNGEEVMFKKKDMETVLAMFQAKGEDVYREMINCIGRTVVSVPQIEQADKLVKKLEEHPYTADIVAAKTMGDVEVFCELPMEFEIEGIKMKCLPDKLRVDHEKKVIDVWDWKTNWDVGRPEKAYLSMGYYIQLGIYMKGIAEWAIAHKLGEYTINPMQFVFIDTKGFLAPVIVQPCKDDIERAWRGFHVSGRSYTGIQTILDEISWSIETGIWNSSSMLEANKGVSRLKLKYGSR